MMTKIEVNISSEYGIMFLHDPNINPDVPADAGVYPVTCTSTCLAFSVLIYVDGDAKIAISNKFGNIKYREYFNGKIVCPSKIIALSDPNGIIFSSVPLKDTFASISLRMSEDINPDFVECVIENIETL